VGLCEYVQHLSMIDYLCFAGTTEGRVAEYVDHLHEHFVEPCVVRNAAYMPPTAPGFSIEMKAETLAEFEHRPGLANGVSTHSEAVTRQAGLARAGVS
jgi:L-fuconate dehydratase